MLPLSDGIRARRLPLVTAAIIAATRKMWFLAILYRGVTRALTV